MPIVSLLSDELNDAACFKHFRSNAHSRSSRGEQPEPSTSRFRRKDLTTKK
jgi:hypothetical protein